MPALIDLRRRIKSVRNTQQITQAMKTVATAKLKKAQRLVMEARPMWHHYPELLSAIASLPEGIQHPLMEKRQERRIQVLILTSDKGLAGAFNSNLLESVHAFLKEKSESNLIQLILMGKKAALYFRKLDYPVARTYAENVQKLQEQDLRLLAGDIMRDYGMHRVDAVYIAYNEFKSILAPQVTVAKLLPIEPPPVEMLPLMVSPDWEPGAASFLHTLLPIYIEDQVCHTYYESIAAEHAARMMAMDNATNNAEELIDSLTLVLNKIRQASITKELLEIMSAVEALSKNR